MDSPGGLRKVSKERWSRKMEGAILRLLILFSWKLPVEFRKLGEGIVFSRKPTGFHLQREHDV